MSPTLTETRVPDHLTLSRRPTCQPSTDEPHLLRDSRGNVRATVECWVPDALN